MYSRWMCNLLCIIFSTSSEILFHESGLKVSTCTFACVVHLIWSLEHVKFLASEIQSGESLPVPWEFIFWSSLSTLKPVSTLNYLLSFIKDISFILISHFKLKSNLVSHSRCRESWFFQTENCWPWLGLAAAAAARSWGGKGEDSHL